MDVVRHTQVVDIEATTDEVVTMANADAAHTDATVTDGTLVLRAHGATVIANADPVAYPHNDYGDPFVAYQVDDVIAFTAAHPYWGCRIYAVRIPDEDGLWGLTLTRGHQGWGPLTLAVEDAIADAYTQARADGEAGGDLQQVLAAYGIVIDAVPQPA